MSKVLREDNDNEYAVAVRDVEKFLSEKRVRLTILSGDCLEVKVFDKVFYLWGAGASFPRTFDDEKLVIPES